MTRTSRIITDLAHRHRGESVILVGHAETVEISINALGLLPVYRSFDLEVSPASITEWFTDAWVRPSASGGVCQVQSPQSCEARRPLAAEIAAAVSTARGRGEE